MLRSEPRERWQLAEACLRHLSLCLQQLLAGGPTAAPSALALEVLGDLQGTCLWRWFGCWCRACSASYIPCPGHSAALSLPGPLYRVKD